MRKDAVVSLGQLAGAWLALLVAASSACRERDEKHTPTTQSSTASSAKAAPSTKARAPEPRPKPPPCRAIGVEGEMTTGERPVVERQPLDGKTWVELKEESKLVIKHATSGREYSITGPARVLPCREGREQVVLASGEIATSVGAGARPGALVLIATPFGVVRYGEATLTVKVDARRAKVRVNTGAAWLAAAESSQLSGQPRLIGPKAEARLESKTPKPAAEKLVGACESAAETAKRQAEDLIRRSKAPKLGERAKTHMQQRAAAREACLVAEAAARLAEEPAEATALQQRVSAANRSWGELPGLPSDEQK